MSNFAIDDGSKLLKVLGIDPENCVEATVYFHAGELVRINANLMVTSDSIRHFHIEMKKYHLVPVE